MRISYRKKTLKRLYSSFQILAVSFLVLSFSVFGRYVFADYTIGQDDVLRISVYGYES